MLETQIAQIAQQVATSSQTPGVFPGQTLAKVSFNLLPPKDMTLTWALGLASV